MRNWLRKFEHCFKSGVCLGLMMFLLFMGFGCVSTRKTTTETVVMNSNDRVVNDEGQNTTTVASSDNQQNKGVVEKSETTTITETRSGHPGILSSTVHAIGWVIALPFRLIGGLIGWIF